ncbi:MAG TPA: hypothetical protein VJ205_01675 [Gammaproteobacteria bacterium]|nr:hypothetical protein [Gammaproteobacteria bacterium]
MPSNQFISLNIIRLCHTKPQVKIHLKSRNKLITLELTKASSVALGDIDLEQVKRKISG